MKRAVHLLIVWVAFTGTSQAQPAPKDDLETVIVTAQKLHVGVTPNAIAHDFIKSYAAPTVLLGTIPRWETGICPETRGLPPQLAGVVNQRIRKIAAEVGAPVKAEHCKPNLSITFTHDPQKLLDNIRSENSAVLGYHGATIVSHSIQAWYGTGIRDIHGRTVIDSDEMGSMEYDNWRMGPGQIGAINFPHKAQAEGWLSHNGLSSDLLTVIVIVDTGRTGSYQVASVADYVAMLALSRTQDYDDCQLMPSIANLLSSRCDDKLKPSEITTSDIAYLRGVYKMDAGAALQVQQDQIAAEMRKSLDGP